MDDVRGDFLGPPHGTTSASVIANTNKIEMALTRTKLNCNSLNADLCRVKIAPSAMCSCGESNETLEHYFFLLFFV